jgi:chemotaxis protein MotB
MATNGKRRGAAVAGLEAWPGYVDALSTLLMVIIFVLLVFVLAQFFLSFALSGRNKALEQVKGQLADVSKMLALEKGHENSLQQTLAQITAQLAATQQDRESLSQQIANLQQKLQSTLTERNALSTQLTAATNQAQTNAGQVTALQGQLAQLKQQLADMKQEEEALNKTVSVNRDTIQAKLADIAQLTEQVRALQALRDQFEKQAENALAQVTTEKQRREAVAAELAKEKDLGNSAAAQIALLNQEVDQLRAQLTSLAQALDIAQQQGKSKDVQIANLGQQLNAALAAKVQELQSYRSEFFGELRKILANKPGIHIVGDRFVIQSDVLFPVNSADLTSDGVIQMSKLAETIQQIAAQIPPNIDWVLDVDGYADKQPITGGRYNSNWDLSAARAISVVQLLIQEGVPQGHLSATGFGDNHPLDPADTPDAYAKNRRIELRLTDYGSNKPA